jgi:short-subunit dehydrogenase
MSRIFITGTSDGLGLLTAQLLVEHGHSVVLHARNVQRAEATHRRLPGRRGVESACPKLRSPRPPFCKELAELDR